MPGWNECSIYDDTCRMRTCAHPTNPRNEVNYLGTKDGTENGSTGSVSVPQSQAVSVSMPSLERLTQAHVQALMAAVDRDAVTNKQPTTELREAFRILCEADLDARGW